MQHPVGNTEILRVAVEDTDPANAQLLANAIADVLPGQIGILYPGNGISVAQPARLPNVCSYPNYKNIFSLACCVGALLSFAVIAVYYFIKAHIIGITGAEANEGKDIVSINIAAVLATSADRILLIDGDMRSSVIAKQLGINKAPVNLTNTIIMKAAVSVMDTAVISYAG